MDRLSANWQGEIPGADRSCVGFSIGIRPPGIMLAPMVVISVWLMWHRRNVSVLVLIAAVIGPLMVGPVVERLLYRLEHGGRLELVLSFALMGKAAMLVREQTTFTGPHAQTLNRLGKELYATYVPVHEFLQNLPSTAALPALTGGYEGIAQFQILTQEIAGWSANTGLPGDVLRNELGYQSITDNIPEYLRLSLIYYIGQWSVTSLTFPPTARTVNNYVATFSPPPLEDRLGKIVFLHPPVSWRSIVVYPAFLIAGLVSLVLTFVLIAFLLHPSLGDRGTGQDIMIAAVFAATCHVSHIGDKLHKRVDPSLLDVGLSAIGDGGAVPNSCIRAKSVRSISTALAASGWAASGKSRADIYIVKP